MQCGLQMHRSMAYWFTFDRTTQIWGVLYPIFQDLIYQSAFAVAIRAGVAGK